MNYTTANGIKADFIILNALKSYPQRNLLDTTYKTNLMVPPKTVLCNT